MDDDDHAELVEAVHAHELAEWAGTRLSVAPHDDTARHAARVLERIGAQLRDACDELATHLDAHGAGAELDPVDAAGAQVHTIGATARDHDHALEVARLATELGYRRWNEWTGAAARCAQRLSEPISMGRPGCAMTVLVVQWRSTSWLTRLPQVLRPSAADLHAFDLPAPFWPLYLPLRPVRLTMERLGRPRRPGPPAPPLSTPSDLIAPLLDFAEVDGTDTVVDMGCGDGRLVVEAARRHGCRAIGFEADPHQAEMARHAVAAAGLDPQVRIVEAHATAADVGGATVVLLFLPRLAAGALIPTLLGALPPGARIVAHEQEPIVTSARPERTEALFGDCSLTVAHRWRA